MFTKNPAHPPVILGDHIDHSAASFDYTYEHGEGNKKTSLFLCPICDSTNVKIRECDGKNDSVLIATRSGGSFGVRVDNGATCVEDATHSGSIYVSIPMSCENGHKWLFDLDQNDGKPVTLGILLDEVDYAPHITVASELSDYDDENSVTDRSQSKILNGEKAVA